MTTDFDMKDILLEASADLQEIFRELITDLIAPQAQTKLMESWVTAPDELKERFAQERPEEYKALKRMLDQGKERQAPYGKR